MRIASHLSILSSPIALSRAVLLLQIPLAVTLGFGTRLQLINQSPILMILLGASFMLGASICFASGNFLMTKYAVFRKNRLLITFIVWIFTGLQTVLISQLIHLTTGGELVSLKVRLFFIPIIWLASLLTASNTLQSRQKYVEKFTELRDTNMRLTQIEEKELQTLKEERALLITVVTGKIKPQLKAISADIRSIESQTQELRLGQALEQIDNYSLNTLRKMINDLNSDILIESLHPNEELENSTPKLRVRNLPLDPIRSLRIAVGVGITLLLPIIGIKMAFFWLIQVVALFAPVFALKFLLTRNAILAKLPQFAGVVTACVAVVLMRSFVIEELPAVQNATERSVLPVISGYMLTVCIFLASVDKYFVDEYTIAASEQETAYKNLTEDLERVQSSRQISRRDLSRLLHGPIQGRLAAVRMKLNMLSEASQSNSVALSQQEIVDLAKKVDEITNEIESFTVRQKQSDGIKLADGIKVLIQNWHGMVEVIFRPDPSAISVLELDPHLTRKVIDACAESITNASRHGNAKQIEIELELVDHDSQIRLKVKDNGKPTNNSFTPGIGLQDISSDGGEWRFELSEAGTTFIVDFPITSILVSKI